MKTLGIVGTAALSLLLGIAAPIYAQEQHEQQEEQKDKATQPAEKKAQPEKPAKQEEKNAKPEEKSAPQHAQQDKSQPKAEHASAKSTGRIPDDRYKANFGREHTFRVSQGDYGNRRFQYGGYWFGFVDPWPSNWLYTQDVFVVDINGVYYLCNPVYPGVNIALNVTL
jgi:hypothetical protein